MTVRLRGHHLLCLLTYAGKGYSPAFTAGFTHIAARIAGGETILMVDGPDDICQPLLNDPSAHCMNASVIHRDKAAIRDVGDLLDRSVGVGDRLVLDPATIAQMRNAFHHGRIRRACARCEWAQLCSDIAATGYADTAIPA